jgi:hypothetical protein
LSLRSQPDDSVTPQSTLTDAAFSHRSIFELFLSGSVAGDGPILGERIPGINGEFVQTIPEPHGYSGFASQLTASPARHRARV